MIKQVILSYSRSIQIFYIYLTLINIVGFILMGIDKYRARNNIWRLKEYILIFIALIGGSIGILFGMLIFRHKTNKNRFCIGIPILYILNVIVNNLIIYILNNSQAMVK